MQDYLTRFSKIDGVWAGDDAVALGTKAAIEQSGRQEEFVLLGESGMNRVTEMIINCDPSIDADIFYPPTLIIPHRAYDDAVRDAGTHRRAVRPRQPPHHSGERGGLLLS